MFNLEEKPLYYIYYVLSETRSSVHSKLRNGGGGNTLTATPAGKGGRRGAAANGTSTAPSSPMPFLPPRADSGSKRKSRSNDDEPTAPPATGAVPTAKKAKIVLPPPPNGSSSSSSSPPPSPVLLECPEPNCSKKYKHINGLKYHQSHAHGCIADDDDTKVSGLHGPVLSNFYLENVGENPALGACVIGNQRCPTRLPYRQHIEHLCCY